MAKEKTFDQLRTLNELFARTGVSASENAEHVRRVLDFLSNEQGEDTVALPFAECVNRLARLHFGPEEKRNLSFVHWAVPNDEHFNPLWIRRLLIAQMKQLAGSHTAFLLITGLREAVCPKGSYWTQKRQEYYDRICDYINELVCIWAAPNSRVQLALF